MEMKVVRPDLEDLIRAVDPNDSIEPKREIKWFATN